MSEAPEVTAARIEAGRARARLMDRAHDLQTRLKPKVLARDAWQGAKIKGADMAEDAVEAVRKRPIAAGAVVTAIALFLAREPLKDLAARMLNGSASEEDEDQLTIEENTESVE